MVTNLVDSNVFVRSVVLSLESFRAARRPHGSASTAAGHVTITESSDGAAPTQPEAPAESGPGADAAAAGGGPQRRRPRGLSFFFSFCAGPTATTTNNENDTNFIPARLLLCKYS